MSLFEHKQYKNEMIPLDNNTFRNCEFTGCTLIFRGGQLPRLESNTFFGCEWRCEGPALRTLEYLHALYQSEGLRPVAQAIIAELSDGDISAPALFQRRLLPGHDVPVLFRFFSAGNWADALANGDVYLSTLKTCREYEQGGRGDPGEATLDYRLPFARGGSEPEFIEMAQRASIAIEGGSRNITIVEASSHTGLEDAWVLCLTDHNTKEIAADFGEYLVQIDQPLRFFDLVTKALSAVNPISSASFGRVNYASREFKYLESEPGPLGFVKPAERYGHQHEVRMLWLPSEAQTIKPIVLQCPEIARLCTRVVEPRKGSPA